MKPTIATAAIFTFFFFQSFKSISQCAVYSVSLEKRVASSAAIAQGKVIEKHTYIDEATGSVYTLNKVIVNAWLKNHSSKTEIEVITLGGVYEGKATIVYPSLQLNKDVEYLFFLEGNNLRNDDKRARLKNPSALQTMIYADMQGAIANEGNNYKDLFARSAVSESVLFSRITKLARSRVLTPGGKEFAARKAINKPMTTANAKVTAVSGFSPTTTNGGTITSGEFITINGSGFGATAGNVFFRNADNGGSSFMASGVASDITSWSDASITVKVPSGAGSGTFIVQGPTNMGSGTPLTVGYTHIEINDDFSGFGGVVTRQRYFLRNMNGSGGYTFAFNNAFNANTAAVNSFNRALATWQCTAGANFISSGTTALATVANDGTNTVFFNPALPPGVLGRATSQFAGSSMGGCTNVNTVWWENDVDVEFAPDPPVAGFTWQYGTSAATGTQYDFESVAVHELGHAIGLGHRIAPGAVMHYAISNGATVRTPSATDISGANAKLSYSTAATCFNPAGSGSPMQLSGCTLPVTFISFSGERKSKTTDELHWEASHSNNNTGYAIERSADGESFMQIGFVDETNPTISEQSYNYADTKAGIYPWYYRLKQTDLDGKYSYSKVIYVKGDNNNNWRAFASSDGNTVHLYGNVTNDNSVKFQLISSSGQQVLTRQVTNAITDINASQLSKGIYFYKIVDKNNSNILSGSLLLGN